MIGSIEEAVQHSKHVNGKHIIVLTDGTIYTESNDELAQSLVDTNECFVVKGGLAKKVKVKKETKQEEIKE